ncbi:PAP2 superfamily-domain-containing protein [Melanogaster broomeanus]|nr:PAP2 superfamily-domain-containing protein [Melanogaster broomeanus]
MPQDHSPAHDSAPGQLPEEIYNSTLPWWRAAIRARVLKAVRRESLILARMQGHLRSSWLDNYFLYTSSLGTHAFFMIALPLLFFFGYGEIGRGLVVVLASGVYFSSLIKDLVCSPRPFAPPVSRLTFGDHHLEYGFPSTHSTNSVSIALFIFSQVHRAYSEDSAISDVTYWFLCAVLAIYAISIVFGRLYTGMHSFTDCGAGVVLGAAIWGVYVMMCNRLDAWLDSGSWSVPLTLVPACLLLVHYHPQPVDDCPCFEGAIAVVSVILGVLSARWHLAYAGFDERLLDIMPGGLGEAWEWEWKVQWCSLAGAKVGIGILIIFVWRLLAKAVLRAVLPPVFRMLALCFDLPRRQFNTPATDFGNVPVQNGSQPVPSVIDLPESLEVSGVNGDEHARNGVRRRCRNEAVKSDSGLGPGLEKGSSAEMQKSSARWAREKHYDADVLTKVIVYAGTGLLSAEGIPILFSIMGWGVKPW